jgi:flagella basal body P-ring formation protein FlgA
LILEARRLRHIAEAYGLNWRPVSKLQRVEVTRASQHITPERIESAVQEAVAAVAPSSADLRISLDHEIAGFYLPMDVVASLDIRDLDYDPVGRRFTATLVAPAKGQTLISRPVAGSVVELARIPVPRRLISAGEIVGTQDMEWILIEADRLSAFHLTDIAQVIGQVAQRPLKAGQPMRTTDVAQTPLIKKNSVVRLIVTSGPMTLSARGRALEDGAFGQAVRVINVDSNRQVSGVVQDAGTVAVAADISAAIN